MTDRDVYKALCTRTENMNSDSRVWMDALLLQLSEPSGLENNNITLPPAPTKHLAFQLPQAKTQDVSTAAVSVPRCQLQGTSRFATPTHISSHLNLNCYTGQHQHVRASWHSVSSTSADFKQTTVPLFKQ